MKIFTIGFTKKSAEKFFETLRKAGVKRVVDVRLFNESQLAGFSKKDDLRYFLRAICGVDYVHRPDFAPTEAMFTAYKKRGGDWTDYAREFKALIRSRGIETTDRALLKDACLLCTEDWPDHCHRRLVAEYLGQAWDDVEIEHLV